MTSTRGSDRVMRPSRFSLTFLDRLREIFNLHLRLRGDWWWRQQVSEENNSLGIAATANILGPIVEGKETRWEEVYNQAWMD